MLQRLAMLALWMLATTGVSYVVARASVNAPEALDVTAPIPPITLDQRATVSLAETTIVPVVSADGTVVQVDSRWMLEAPAPSDAIAYRLLDPPVAVRARISGGPSGFGCEWAGLGQAGAGGATPLSARELAPTVTGVTLRCAIPDDVRVAAGMRGTMVLQMAEPKTVQALPVTAVVGDADRGEVIVVDGESIDVRVVELGISDIFSIEIVSGLGPSDIVLQNPTQADFDRSRAE